jgi:hypothetical protein
MRRVRHGALRPPVGSKRATGFRTNRTGCTAFARVAVPAAERVCSGSGVTGDRRPRRGTPRRGRDSTRGSFGLMGGRPLSTASSEARVTTRFCSATTTTFSQSSRLSLGYAAFRADPARREALRARRCGQQGRARGQARGGSSIPSSGGTRSFCRRTDACGTVSQRGSDPVQTERTLLRSRSR